MSWGLFAQVVFLIIIFAFVTTAVKCFHDKNCIKCHKE